jgi:type III secretory pathway component EscS
LTSISFSFLRLNLTKLNFCAALLLTVSLTFATTRQWSESKSAPLKDQTSATFERRHPQKFELCRISVWFINYLYITILSSIVGTRHEHRAALRELIDYTLQYLIKAILCIITFTLCQGSIFKTVLYHRPSIIQDILSVAKSALLTLYEIPSDGTSTNTVIIHRLVKMHTNICRNVTWVDVMNRFSFTFYRESNCCFR